MKLMDSWLLLIALSNPSHRQIFFKYRKGTRLFFGESDGHLLWVDSLCLSLNELAQVTKADIYIVIRQGNKYYIYKSTDRPGWPPSE